MPWESRSPMELRNEFINIWLKEDFTFSELCREFGISRKTGYKYIGRFTEYGKAGLLDVSRRPHSHPATTCDEVVKLICKERDRHHGEGAATLLEFGKSSN